MNDAIDDRISAPSSLHSGLWRSFARFGATRLPRWWLRYSPGPIGALIGALQPKARGWVLDNQRLIHGPRPALVEARDVLSTFAEFGHALAEGLAAGADRPPKFAFTVEGAEHADRLRTERRGAIMVTAHVGAWDVTAPSLLSHRDLQLGMVMRAEPDARAQEVSNDARIKGGVKVFHVGTDPLAALPLMQHVKSGGVVALQIDRVPEGMRSHPSTLFGRRWQVPLGPFQIAQLTGMPIIPIFTARLGFLHHIIHADPWIEVPRRATEAQLSEVIDTATGAMERFLRRFPKQWFHFAPPSDVTSSS